MVKRLLSALLILIMILTSFSLFSCTPKDNGDDPNAPTDSETPEEGENPEEGDGSGDGETPDDGNGGQDNISGGQIDLPRDEFD